MNEQDIVNKLKSDPRALKSVMQSQDGQALLNMLSGGGGGGPFGGGLERGGGTSSMGTRV